jgi:hypothetical protein
MPGRTTGSSPAVFPRHSLQGWSLPGMATHAQAPSRLAIPSRPACLAWAPARLDARRARSSSLPRRTRIPARPAASSNSSRHPRRSARRALSPHTHSHMEPCWLALGFEVPLTPVIFTISRRRSAQIPVSQVASLFTDQELFQVMFADPGDRGDNRQHHRQQRAEPDEQHHRGGQHAHCRADAHRRLLDAPMAWERQAGRRDRVHGRLRQC